MQLQGESFARRRRSEGSMCSLCNSRLNEGRASRWVSEGAGSRLDGADRLPRRPHPDGKVLSHRSRRIRQGQGGRPGLFGKQEEAIDDVAARR